MRYRRWMVVWLVLDREPAIVGCAVVGVIALDEPTEGVRLGLIERLRGREEDVGGLVEEGSTLRMKKRKDCRL